MSRNTLVVTTRAGWVHDELAVAATDLGLAVARRDFGFDPPDVDVADIAAWWLPLDHAARMRREGFGLPWLSCGPSWLAALDEDLTYRRIVTATLGGVAESPRWAGETGVLKLAEAKHEALPCTRSDDVGGAASAAIAAGVSSRARVEIADRWVPAVCCEHRHWVAGDVATSACYLHAGEVWNAPDFVDCPEHAQAAWGFAQAVVDTVACPPGFTLDVAVTSAGRCFVLEANPVFSSGLYDGADRELIVGALRAGLDFAARYPQWAWTPDPTYDPA